MKKIKIDKEELKRAILSGKGTIELQKLHSVIILQNINSADGLNVIKYNWGMV